MAGGNQQRGVTGDTQPLVVLSYGRLIRLDTAGGAGENIELALLHVQLGPDRKVLESEVCAAADLSRAQRAQEWFKGADLSGIPAGHLYVNLRFVPHQ